MNRLLNIKEESNAILKAPWDTSGNPLAAQWDKIFFKVAFKGGSD